MNDALVTLLVGLLYTVMFGGLSLLRREGLSLRFAFEAVGLTLLVTVVIWVTGLALHPAIFFVLLYLVTMRVRILTDLGNMFAQRRKFPTAERIYNLALSAGPDPASRIIVDVNRGTSLLQQGQPDQAIQAFKQVLAHSGKGYLGIKYESAAHYNMAVAYERKHMDAQAIIEFNAVLDTWPASIYARAAQKALKRHQHPGGDPKPVPQDGKE
ncbi:MAG TPA: tetratricopeptide repeat protein [Anaerolineaceae bacterium]